MVIAGHVPTSLTAATANGGNTDRVLPIRVGFSGLLVGNLNS